MDSIDTKIGLVTVSAMLLLGMAGSANAQDRWEWRIAPYLWASDIKETTFFDGSLIGGSDTEFSDLVDITDTGVTLRVEAHKGKWGWFGDISYAESSDQDQDLIATVDVNIEDLVLDFGGMYRPAGFEDNLDLLFGIRYLSIEEQYLFTFPGSNTLALTVDEDYTDVLLGARIRVPLSERWLLAFSGDLSFADSEGTYTAQGLINYKFGSKRQHQLSFGYRYRELEYDRSDTIEVEKTVHGPVLGIVFGF